MTEEVHRQLADFFKDDLLAPYIYALSERLSQGHICIALGEVNDKLDLPEDYVLQPISVAKNNFLLGTPEKIAPIILDDNRLYFQRYYAYETTIVETIKSRAGSEIDSPREEKITNWKSILNNFIPSDTEKKDKTNWQKVAAISAALQSFTIITGGPGTGKTTTVAAVLALLFSDNPNLSVAVAAPTGKAAARVAESLRMTVAEKNIDETLKNKFLSLEPFTLHRLLGYKRNSTSFAHNKTNQLRYDVVIVDECSMIDAAMLAKLLQSLHPKTRLILLGDKDQLAAVEAGSIFGDLCRSVPQLNIFSAARAELINSCLSDNKEYLSAENISDTAKSVLQNQIVVLQHSHRFSDDSGIGKLSKAVISGDKNKVKSFLINEEEAVKITPTFDEKIFAGFIKKYIKYVEEKDIVKALDALQDCKILCAVREGTDGVVSFNNRVQSWLIDKGHLKYDHPFYINRPIMVTNNLYNLGLFNGDIGVIRENEQGKRMAYFLKANGELIEIWPGYLQSIETVFAMTIHKSQGSEYKEAYIVLPQDSAAKGMSAELLYTAITRAKKSVIIQGSEVVIMEAVGHRIERSSGIVERLS